MSIADAARPPKRERGRQRVAALMDAAARVIASHGYAAATMTAIAAEAGAAIGSLYQFFPTKAAIAEALLARYGERLTATLGVLEAEGARLTPGVLAEALVGMMYDLKADRAAVVALLDVQDNSGEARQSLRGILLGALQRLLAQVRPDLAGEALQLRAMMLLYLVKAVPAMIGDEPALSQALRAEAVQAMRLCIAG